MEVDWFIGYGCIIDSLFVSRVCTWLHKIHALDWRAYAPKPLNPFPLLSSTLAGCFLPVEYKVGCMIDNASDDSDPPLLHLHRWAIEYDPSVLCNL